MLFPCEKGTVNWAIQQISVCSIDGRTDAEFFKRFKKQSYEGKADFSKYHLGGRFDPSYCWDPDVTSYLDARDPVLLRWSGRPIAVSSFRVGIYNGEEYMKSESLNKITDEVLCVMQLQGLPHFYGGGLEVLRWEKMFVSLFEDYAIQFGFSSTAILPASRNEAMGENEKSKMRYDVTAKRMGYKMEHGYWIKHLK
jgi:hypothetical protein